MRRRITALIVSFIAILGIGVVAAPAAMATPSGCGDLSNGQLCLNTPGPSGTYEVSYYRHAGTGSITVEMGVQHKTPNGTVHPVDWINTRTIAVGKYGTVYKYYTADRDWCARGAMKSGNTTYITKWVCW